MVSNKMPNKMTCLIDDEMFGKMTSLLVNEIPVEIRCLVGLDVW